MRLVFEDRYEQEREIAQCKNLAGAFDEIKKFLDDHNYKSYYHRVIHYGPTSESCAYYWIDVGSHSEFFKLYEDKVCD